MQALLQILLKSHAGHRLKSLLSRDESPWGLIGGQKFQVNGQTCFFSIKDPGLEMVAISEFISNGNGLL